ncbi:MAG: NAD(P)/FAD-dependent oxidoreductase [Lachnoclostridium edouardi]|uniref:NAD(P)/FAD-dependent oxidoreductase n=1 Tax=Lachnoclostridium edouardi TaxID=1926283 RepID=UPI0026DD5F26|nr:NAD(P)/FAD-dependent oxidoreductase [Lachnoclostridium edouardi]MDO4277726.1 NAD(P)/FAD-dependent oxidoreductase [Lachnoclostridium edouardi]
MSKFDYDVAVIGGGAVGACTARELSRYDLHICLLEKEEDVCSGTSKANSAIVHAGYDAENGSLKAKFNLEGNKMMEGLSKELDFEFIQNGSLVLCFAQEDMPALKKLYEKGINNGVEGLELLSGDQIREMEPNISQQVYAGLYAPTGGIVCPFGLTIAMAENACTNGVEFRFSEEVKKVEKMDEGYALFTSSGEVKARYVVNAAGVYADVYHNMVSGRQIHITPRKGEYCLLDKEGGKLVSHTIFQLPGKYGKGVLVSPTVHGNLLLGPTAVDINDKENTATTEPGLADVIEKSGISVKNIPLRQTITSFAGLRAHEDGDDFIIGEPEDAEGFFDAAGIESPGLTAAPAIGKYLAQAIAEKAGAKEKKEFCQTRKGIPRVASLSHKERAKLIQENPLYGTIICRCEEISEGEIVDAIKRPLGAKSLDGIKRRVRAGMGRCQAGFCTPKTMEILERETGIPMENICKNRDGSQMLTGRK